MIPVDVRADEWLSALQDAMTPDSTDGKTVRELSDSTGMSDKCVRKLIVKLQAQGRVVCKKAVRIGIDGRRALVPAYVIVPQEKAS
jgi:hypothetical protein